MTIEAHIREIVREEVAAVVSALKADLSYIQSAIEAVVKPAKAKKAAAPETAPPATAPAAAAPAPAAAPVTAPAVPPVTREQLNEAVLAVAKVNRQMAIDILAKFGVTGTPTLPVEKYQAVLDEFEEAKAKLDAAATQVSLV